MNTLCKVIIAVVVSFCSIIGQTNPCEDSLFLYLKSIPLNEMSERQYSYFMQKDRYCLENHAAIMKKANTTLLCTLHIRADRYEFEDSQDQFNPEVYVDDNRMGIPPQVVVVPEGQHTISLIASNQIRWEEEKVLKSKDRIAQLYSLVAKNVFEGDGVYHIHFEFVCDKGDNKKCDKNEWKYLCKVSKMK